MNRERTSVGLDGHARSVVAWGVDGETGELFRARLCPQPEVVLGWLRELPGPVAVVYEAGPTGYRLARFLTSHKITCVVAAPSSCSGRLGDRVKETRRTRCIWPGCCDLVRSRRWGCRRWRRKPPGIWSAPGKTSAGI